MSSDSEPVTDPGFTSPPRTSWARVGSETFLWLRTLTSAAVYATLIVTFVFQVARVEGRSMQPTLEDRDRLVVNKLAYHIHDPQVGDIVMLLHPGEPSKALVKRIVAEAGDTVAFQNGLVVRNGVLANEDFIPPHRRSHEDRAAMVVPAGHYFVLGDHRNNSADSRTLGAVPKKYILGRVQVRWWPLARAKFYAP